MVTDRCQFVESQINDAKTNLYLGHRVVFSQRPDEVYFDVGKISRSEIVGSVETVAIVAIVAIRRFGNELATMIANAVLQE